MALGRMVIVALVAVVAVGLSGVTYAVAVAPQTNAQPQAGSDAPTYGVTFQETGLAAGTNWGVTVFGPWGSGEDGSHFQSSANSSMAFSLPNGTYRYDVRNVLGYDIAANGSRGTFNVSGGMATSIDVSFVPLPTYDVTFTEAGLAPGTTWTVTVFPSGEAEGDGMGVLSTATLSSNTTTLTFALPNGTYSYYVHAVSGYELAENSSFGDFTVSGSAVASIAVTFVTPTLYTVTFTESGLAAGTNWSVTVVAAGEGEDDLGWDPGPTFITHSSNGTAITFALPNGTYGYWVHPVAGYQVGGNGSFGGFRVSGSPPPTLSVSFVRQASYTVTFTESGLVNGTNWSVTVVASGSGGDQVDWGSGPGIYTESSSGTSLTFSLPNGTYAYYIHEVSGFQLLNESSYGTFVVAGGPPAPITLSFVADTGDDLAPPPALARMIAAA